MMTLESNRLISPKTYLPPPSWHLCRSVCLCVLYALVLPSIDILSFHNYGNCRTFVKSPALCVCTFQKRSQTADVKLSSKDDQILILLFPKNLTFGRGLCLKNNCVKLLKKKCKMLTFFVIMLNILFSNITSSSFLVNP